MRFAARHFGAFILCLSAAFSLYIGAILYVGLTANPEHADVAVVLGNEVLRSGKPSDRLAARLDCAIALYRTHALRRIIVSGGTGKSGFSEAVVMADYLRDHAIPADDIITDERGRNTMATAENTAAIIQAQHFSGIVVVTQYYHIPRCLLSFWHAGVAQVSAAYPRYFEWYDIPATLREAIALPVYFAKMQSKETVR